MPSSAPSALESLDRLPVKVKASAAARSLNQFGSAWTDATNRHLSWGSQTDGSLPGLTRATGVRH